MSIPGPIGPSSSAYAAYLAAQTPATPDPNEYANTYDLNRDGTITDAEITRRDLAGLFDTASPIPFLHSGPSFLHLDEGWIPQGQGYDAQREETLTTYYTDTNDNGHGDTVRLSVQDRHTGVEARDVILLGKRADGSDRPAHGGGVASYGEFVLVADTQEIHVYRRSEIDTPTWNPDTQRYEVRDEHVVPMPDVPAEYLGQVVTNEDSDQSPASYLTVHGDTLYVGSWSRNDDHLSGGVHRFDLDPQTGEVSASTGFIKAPDQSQGFTVIDDGRGLLFASNHESNKLVYQPITNTADTFAADPSERKVLDEGRLIGSYVEEINVIDGELWVTYESGAHPYRDDVDDPHGSIQRIPLSELGDDFPG